MNKVVRLVCAGVLLAATLGAAARDWSLVRIAVEGAYPPFSSVNADGTLVGFDIDFANALCEQMQVRCTLVQQDWDGMIPALLARKYDAIVASMSITQERKLKVDFTHKYYQTPARFARRKGSGIEISKAGLAGRSVGVQRATTHDNFVSAQFGDAAFIKRYASQDEAYLDAAAGRLDLLLADSVALQDGFLATPAGQAWEFTGPGYTDAAYFGEGIGIAVRKGEQALLHKLNAAIEAIRSNGTYKRINDRYFAFDVYGG